MYTVKREDGKIIIENWKGEQIYKATEHAYLIHGTENSTLKVNKIGNMEDRELLTAFLNAKKLEF